MYKKERKTNNNKIIKIAKMINVTDVLQLWKKWMQKKKKEKKNENLNNAWKYSVWFVFMYSWGHSQPIRLKLESVIIEMTSIETNWNTMRIEEKTITF